MHVKPGDITNVTYIQGEANLGEDANHTAFFPGCALYAYAPELTAKVSQWLRDEDIAAYTLTICCGATFYDVGFYDEYDAYRERVQAFLREKEIKRLVVTCPHCAHLLPQLIEGMEIEIVRLPDLLVERGMISQSTETIAFHDACYDRSAGFFGRAARSLFENCDIQEHAARENAIACAAVGAAW